MNKPGSFDLLEFPLLNCKPLKRFSANIEDEKVFKEVEFECSGEKALSVFRDTNYALLVVTRVLGDAK